MRLVGGAVVPVGIMHRAMLAVVILAGCAALLLAAFVGRWKVVPDADYRPGIEI